MTKTEFNALKILSSKELRARVDVLEAKRSTLHDELAAAEQRFMKVEGEISLIRRLLAHRESGIPMERLSP